MLFHKLPTEYRTRAAFATKLDMIKYKAGLTYKSSDDLKIGGMFVWWSTVEGPMFWSLVSAARNHISLPPIPQKIFLPGLLSYIAVAQMTITDGDIHTGILHYANATPAPRTYK